MIIADSDVLIDALAGIEPHRETILQLLYSQTLAVSAIAYFELLLGARTSGERDRIFTLLQAVAILPFDQDAAREAARVGQQLLRNGQRLPTADLAIAGICLVRKAPLLTRNMRHFERIDGLDLIRP